MDNGKLSTQLISDALAALFQELSASEIQWTSSAAKNAKEQLKKILFPAQNSKCAYCRRTISDEPGHVEIDHILPKNSFGEEDLWKSNNRECRKNTAGYNKFTFTPHNLALTCKLCNNKKHSYDSRLNRRIPPVTNYSLYDNYYEWIHIYLHNYSDHIVILKNLIYQVVENSPRGDAVITVCKLDEIAAVEAAAAELRIQNVNSISKAIGLLLGHVEMAGWDFIMDKVSNQFPTIPISEIEIEIRKYKDLYK